MAKLRIMLTGATGFLGSNLLAALLRKDYEVIVIKRSTSNTRRIANYLDQVTCLDCDVPEFSAQLAQQKVDVVIHAATNYGRTGDGVSTIFAANTVLPLQLLDWAVKNQVKTFINTDTVLPANLNPYALSKAQFLAWGQYFSQRSPLHFINIKLEHMFGPGDDSSKFTTHIIESCRQHVPEIKLTLGEQQRDFIYIDDVISAYLTLVEQEGSGFDEYELGSGQIITIREFAEMAHRLSHSKSILLFGAIPYRDNEMMYSVANINKLQALGWKMQYTVEHGIRKTLQGI
jgi:nucleoside-diphosphate-sugar epimerase